MESDASNQASPLIDAVLTEPPPLFTGSVAVEIAKATFDLEASDAINLGSERDQAFMLRNAAGEGLAVMKVSNSAEDAEVLDMEALAVRYASGVDPSLPIAMPRRAAPGSEGPAAFRARWPVSEVGAGHWVRIYDVIPGRARVTPTEMSDTALGAFGTTTARLGRALRGFAHPRAIRTMPWDVQHALRCRTMLSSIRDAAARLLVSRVLDDFEEVVLPRWAGLRAQVVHSDFTIDNALIDGAGFVTGIIDFGDMSHSALLIDLASVLDSMCGMRSTDEMLRTSRLIVDGYQRVTPLETDELQLLPYLWATRSSIGVAISSWRAQQGLEDPTFAERYNESALTMVEQLLSARSTIASAENETTDALTKRRQRALGPALESLSYDQPIRMASADGVWMTDHAGTRYLDAYNNVPCVGHSHPRVSTAIARQSSVLNTNMRYLHGSAIELAERLVATCGSGLDTVFFVNSGSEANDLAWRMAATYTGNSGGLCTAHAYHGISEAIAALSPESWSGGTAPHHVERWTPPDSYRGLDLDPANFADALARLAERGIEPAAAILDGVLQSDGVLDLDPRYAQELVRLTHNAGGLWIADEVQGGHGRTGEAMWAYERFAIEPDFVTLGKPMGNGHPVAAVITRRDIAERFAADTVFFSTFGGNQVSVAAAHAVLDVIADERVLSRVQRAGDVLRAAIGEVVAPYDVVGDVRGVGLAIGVEIVTDRSSQQADPAAAVRIRDGLRVNGVLVGTTGAAGNVLKVRPPLAFTEAEVPVFAAALAATLETIVAA